MSVDTTVSTIEDWSCELTMADYQNSPSAAHSGDQMALHVHPLTRGDVLTAREVGDLLRIPKSTVYDLARRGELPAHRVGRAWRFLREEIEAWLRAS